MNRKVLIVDDEPALRRSLERALRVEDYEVRTAADADSAYAILTEVAVDCVLLDLQMPQVSGDALAVAMMHRWPYITGRIVIMTGDPFVVREGWPEVLQRCPVLDKPFSLEQLSSTIGNLIALAESEAATRRETGRRKNGRE